MKCPKCGYMSFDFNQICPKCSKDISVERDKMSLPPFRPAPPSLLGALTGEAGDSNVGLESGGSAAFASSGGEAPFSPEDSQTIEAMEEAFEDSQSLEMQIEATPEEEIPFSAEKSDEELSADLEDLIIDSSDAPSIDPELETEDDAVSLDFEDLPDDGTETVFDENMSVRGESGDSLSLDLDPLEFDTDNESTSLDLEEPSDEEPLSAFEEDITVTGEDEFATAIDEMISDDAPEPLDSDGEIESVDLEDLELDLELDQPNGKPS